MTLTTAAEPGVRITIRRRLPLPPALALPALLVLLILTVLIALSIGSFWVSPTQSLAILLHKIGINLPVTYSHQHESVLLSIRLPRTVLGALVGAALAVSGVVIQGLFRNPLASPDLVGVSSGASVGATLAIAFGAVASVGIWMLPLAAFATGMAATLIIYRLAHSGGRTEVTTLLLVGLAVNALNGAFVSFLTIYVASEPQLRSIVFWLLGSLSGSSWQSVIAAAPFIAVSLLVQQRYGRALNLLVLGDAEARHLGLDTERVRIGCIVLAALATGAATALVGIVGFVGLIVPHVMRLLVGPDHRALLIACGLGGATLLVGADLLARTLAAPDELPLGLLTSFIGAPFFLYLILRTRRHHGGWG